MYNWLLFCYTTFCLTGQNRTLLFESECLNLMFLELPSMEVKGFLGFIFGFYFIFLSSAVYVLKGLCFVVLLSAYCLSQFLLFTYCFVCFHPGCWCRTSPGAVLRKNVFSVLVFKATKKLFFRPIFIIICLIFSFFFSFFILRFLFLYFLPLIYF